MRNLEYLPRKLWWVATKALQRRPKLRVLIRKSKENQKRGREEMKREGEGEKWKGEKEVRNLREREGEGLGFSNEEGKVLTGFVFFLTQLRRFYTKTRRKVYII